MKRLLIIIGMLGAIAHAAIGPVGGTVKSGLSSTNDTITYSPTAGDPVSLWIILAGSVTSLACADNNSNALIAGPTVTNTIQLAEFHGTAVTGATSYKCTWLTARANSMLIEEYSGVSSINAALSGNTASGTSATASVSQTTQDNNDWIVCALSSSANAITVTAGQSRQVESTAPKATLLDNTVATAGSVSCTGTLTSGAWVAGAIELRVAATAAAGFDKKRKLARLQSIN